MVTDDIRRLHDLIIEESDEPPATRVDRILYAAIVTLAEDNVRLQKHLDLQLERFETMELLLTISSKTTPNPSPQTYGEILSDAADVLLIE